MSSRSDHTPSLPRSISAADISQTERCREYIKKAWVNPPPPQINYFKATPSFTLTIPSLTDYCDKEFRSFVFDRIINYRLKEDLEETSTLNWCPNTTSIVPLYTTGDGNCLLHAASLSMWGFQDNNYTLREAVYRALLGGRENSLYVRWKEWRQNELRQISADLDPHQWKEEWGFVVESSSLKKPLGYLDQFHIFTLCNVLRRPIFMYANSKIHSQQEGVTLQKIDFYGIYLPLLWDPESCIKNPLPLVFNNGHFSALSIIDEEKEYTRGSLLFPLIDCYGNELPVRFLMHSESEPQMKRQYLNICFVPPPRNSYYIKKDVPCAELILTEQPKYMKPLLDGFIKRCHEVFLYQKKAPPTAQRDCHNKCGFAGNDIYDGYCSSCYKKKLSERGYLNNEYKNDEHIYSNSSEQHRAEWRNAPTRSEENELEASTVLCSNNCNRVGYAKYLGMCEECYKSQKPSNSSSTSSSKYLSDSSSHSSKQERSAILPPSQGEESRPCRTPGCDFFGKEAMKFYCSQCFEKNMPRMFESGQLSLMINDTSPRNRSQSQEDDDNPLCVSCVKFHANPEYGNYCSSCFKEKTKKESRAKPHNMTPPTQRRNEPPTHQDIPPTHQRDTSDCIICNASLPLGNINIICKEHAMRCRYYFTQERHEPVRGGERLLPERDEYRVDYERSHDPPVRDRPEREGYKRSPEHTRNNYNYSPDPVGYSPDPVGYTSDPVRYSPDPTRGNYKRSDPVDDEYSNEPFRRRHSPDPTRRSPHYNICRTSGCNGFTEEGFEFCSNCHDYYNSLTPIHDDNYKPLPPQNWSRRSSEPQLTRYEEEERGVAGAGTYTPPERIPSYEQRPHPLNISDNKPRPQPRIPRNIPKK